MNSPQNTPVTPPFPVRTAHVFALLKNLEGASDEEILRVAAIAARAKADPVFSAALDQFMEVTQCR